MIDQDTFILSLSIAIWGALGYILYNSIPGKKLTKRLRVIQDNNIV